MPEKKKVYIKFEGVIPESTSGEGLAETDKAWLVEINIPEKYAGKEAWIPKSLVKDNVKVVDNLIRGEVENWVLPNKFDPPKKNVDTAEPTEFAQTEVEVIQPASEEKPGIVDLTPNPVIIELLKINMKMDKIIKLLEEK